MGEIGKRKDEKRPEFIKEVLVDKKFDKVDMKHACFIGSELYHVQAEGCSFVDAEFYNAKVRRCSFVNCDFGSASFMHATLESVMFAYCRLENAEFGSAQLENVSFVRSPLKGANFTRARATNLFGPISVCSLGYHTAIAAGGYISIECQRYDYERWLDLAYIIGEQYGYTERDVARYLAWAKIVIPWLEEEEAENAKRLESFRETRS